MDVVAIEMRGPPVWPTMRPKVARMCCPACWMAAVAMLWRCSRALHLMVFDTPDETTTSATGMDAATHGPSWPWKLPDLAHGDNFAAGASACLSLAEWAHDIVGAMQRQIAHGDVDEGDIEWLNDLEFHFLATYKQLEALSSLLLDGTKGTWDRARAVWLANGIVRHLTGLCLTEL